MPGPERVLTWSGEPRGRRREASGPEDTLDAASAVNRPRAVPIGTDDDRPGLARKGLLEPGAVKAARRGSEGAPAAAMRRGYPTAQQVTDEAGDGRRIVSRPAGSRQPNIGSGRPRSFGALAGGRAEVAVDLAGGVTLQAADDLRLGFPFGGAALGVGAGGRVRAQPGEHDPPQGMAVLAVTA